MTTEIGLASRTHQSFSLPRTKQAEHYSISFFFSLFFFLDQQQASLFISFSPLVPVWRNVMIRATLFFTHFKERTRVISQIVEESTTPSSVCNRRFAFLGADIKEYYTNGKSFWLLRGCCVLESHQLRRQKESITVYNRSRIKSARKPTRSK